MSRQHGPKLSKLIITLNSIGVGELASITSKLEGVRSELSGLGQPELAENLDSARSAIQRGDMAEFRRLLSQTVSRLGHVRDKA